MVFLPVEKSKSKVSLPNLAKKVVENSHVQSHIYIVIYKLTEGMPQSSKWVTVKKRLCNIFIPVSTKMHTVT